MSAASDSIWALVSGLPSGKRERQPFMVLQAYIDDSGSDKGSTKFVLAGYVATAKNWANFSDEFELLKHKQPGFDYLRAAEAMHMRGQFAESRGWSRNLRDQRIEEVAKLLRKHVNLQLSIVMDRADFEGTIKNLPVMNGRRSQANDHPYLFLWYKLISEYFLRGQDHGLREPCSFIFDEQLGYADNVLRTWRMMKGIIQESGLQPANRMIGNPPIFMDDKDNAPLQAADLHAWSVRRQLASSDLEEKLSQVAIDELVAIPSMHMTVTREHLIKLFLEQISIAQSLAQKHPNATWTFPDD